MFNNQFFGPRNGFEFRDWQSECGDAYAADVMRFRESFGVEVQHRFTVIAGTGSGKTKAVAGLAAWLLNMRFIDQIVFVCPNRAIRRKTQKDLRHFFNIHLAVFHKAKHKEGIPREVQGYILTYGALRSDPTLHRRICSRTATLVIFDEIHHLGDESAWGAAAEEAFGKVPFVIGMSGTPYRSDNRRIPFVLYEDAKDESGLLQFRADYSYNLGRAVADGVCRDPLFVFHRGKVRIRPDTDAGEIEVTFDDTRVSEAISALRLCGAVRYGAETRRRMLADALARCRDERRKVIIFLGGDTEGDQTPSEDARIFLPEELITLGISPTEFEIVTGDDKEAHGKIESFGASEKWILISINMVSEGVDIAELSAAIFLTSITAKQTTVQRIGRILRRMGEDDPFADALVFMFGDPNYKRLEDEIRAIITHEVCLKRAKRGDGEAATGGDGTRRQRAEAVGIEGGQIETTKFHGVEIPIRVIDDAREELRRRGLPSTMLYAFLQVTCKV